MIKNRPSNNKKKTGYYHDDKSTKEWRRTGNSCPEGRSCDFCGAIARKVKEEKTLAQQARELREILNNEE